MVFGAGIAGLLAARVLADHADRVTLVERDRLSSGPRRGVPQGWHAHALLPRGQHILQELFPGLRAELVAGGAVSYELLDEARTVVGGHRLCRAPMLDTPGLALSRPFLEDNIRRRLLERSNVTLLDGWDAIEPVIEDGRVVAARIGRSAPASHGSEEQVLPAELVVDAMGRAGRSATWLAHAGYGRPATEEVALDVGYSTCYLEMPDGVFGQDLGTLISGSPGNPRSLAAFKVEGDRWVFGLGGMCGDHPPADREGFLDFAASVVRNTMPDLLPAVQQAKQLTKIFQARYPSAIRRRFDRMARLPAGLLALGDSLCSFDPLYGQGMSTAAIQAIALRDSLARGAGLERRYFQAAIAAVTPVWKMALAADLAIPGVSGKSSLSSRALGRYIERVQHAATHSPAAAVAMLRVLTLLEPPASLFSPSIVRQVLRSSGGGLR